MRLNFIGHFKKQAHHASILCKTMLAGIIFHGPRSTWRAGCPDQDYIGVPVDKVNTSIWVYWYCKQSQEGTVRDLKLLHLISKNYIIVVSFQYYNYKTRQAELSCLCIEGYTKKSAQDSVTMIAKVLKLSFFWLFFNNQFSLMQLVM